MACSWSDGVVDTIITSLQELVATAAMNTGKYETQEEEKSALDSR
jgi:hypothetical protein